MLVEGWLGIMGLRWFLQLHRHHELSSMWWEGTYHFTISESKILLPCPLPNSHTCSLMPLNIGSAGIFNVGNLIMLYESTSTEVCHTEVLWSSLVWWLRHPSILGTSVQAIMASSKVTYKDWSAAVIWQETGLGAVKSIYSKFKLMTIMNLL